MNLAQSFVPASNAFRQMIRARIATCSSVIYITLHVRAASRRAATLALTVQGWSLHITEGTAFDKHGRPFRRRNYLPGIIVFAALAVVTLVIWVMALNRPADVTRGRGVQPPGRARRPRHSHSSASRCRAPR